MTRVLSAAPLLLLSALLAVPSASPFVQSGELRPAVVSENAELASRTFAEQALLVQERAARARLRAQHDDLEARLRRAAREGKDIEAYEPYLSGTHDENMYRVVKDRAQWLHIVMGRPSGADEHATDAEQSRIPLHAAIRAALAMDLRSPG